MIDENKQQAARTLCDLMADYYEHWISDRDRKREDAYEGTSSSVDCDPAPSWSENGRNKELNEKSLAIVELLFGIVGEDLSEKLNEALKDLE